MRILVFANGSLKNNNKIISTYDFVIAVDGGAKHCRNLSITPNIIIGDLDSIDEKTLSAYEDHVEIIKYPPKKDATDLELALLYILSKEPTSEVYILAAFGMQYDQTLANILLMTKEEFRQMKIVFVEGKQLIYIVRDKLIIHGDPGDKVSLVPIKGDATGVTTLGLEYSLHNETLYFGSTRGVSNVIQKNKATVLIQQGVLLAFVMRR